MVLDNFTLDLPKAESGWWGVAAFDKALQDYPEGAKVNAVAGGCVAAQIKVLQDSPVVRHLHWVK